MTVTDLTHDPSTAIEAICADLCTRTVLCTSRGITLEAKNEMAGDEAIGRLIDAGYTDIQPYTGHGLCFFRVSFPVPVSVH